MIFKKLQRILFLALSVSSCVTTHLGDPVVDKNQQYLLSCAKNFSVRSQHFLVVTCTVENKSDQWLDVKFSSFDLQGSGANLSTPEEIAAFQESYRLQAEQDDQNAALLLSGLIITGATLSAGSHNSGIRDSTAIAALGGAAAVSVTAPKSRSIYSSEHLLGDTLKVPPGMFTRRDLVVEVGKAGPQSDQALVCTSEPEKDCLNVTLHLGRQHFSAR